MSKTLEERVRETENYLFEREHTSLPSRTEIILDLLAVAVVTITILVLIIYIAFSTPK